MNPLLTAEQMRRMDAHTIESVGVPGVALMETAGRGVFQELWDRFGVAARSGPVAVVCGEGNNGGDGFVVARCLLNRGAEVVAYLLGRREAVDPAGDARVHLDAYVNSGGRLVEAEGDLGGVAEAVARAGLVVDAIFGTGLSREVGGLAAAAIGWINRAEAPVVSVDIPSGVASDSGRVCGCAVAADLTVTFAFPKRGHYLYPGAKLAGTLRVVDIGIPQDILSHVPVDLFLLPGSETPALPARDADAHKGTLGHVVVVGGSPGKTGAPELAATAALRSGAGLVTVVWPRGLDAVGRLPPEVMSLPLPGGGPGEVEWSGEGWDEARALVSRGDALVVGPGMGTGAEAGAVLRDLLTRASGPMVLDADALNLLAALPDRKVGTGRPLVLTPHPGEAGRLLGTDAGVVQADRVAAVDRLAERFGCVVVLKGAGTLVAAPDQPTCLLPVGNPGMATAGSGDVLAGVIGALLARGLTAVEAARCGVALHGAAGDHAAVVIGEDGLTAGDIVAALPAVIRTVARGG